MTPLTKINEVGFVPSLLCVVSIDCKKITVKRIYCTEYLAEVSTQSILYTTACVSSLTQRTFSVGNE
jgi:hypothetical protein